MKILYLLNAYANDGPGIMIRRIAEHLLQREDIEIKTSAISRGGILEEEFEKMGIPTSIIGMRNSADWPRYENLKKFIAEEKFDIVHTNILRADLFGRRAAKAAGTPLIISTEHGIHAWQYRGKMIRRLVKRFYLKTSEYTDAIIAVSDYVKDSLKKEGVAPEKIVRIYNGVPPEKYKPLSEEEKEKFIRLISEKTHERVIGYVGNLIEMKGIRYFIKSLPDIFQKFPRTLALIAGDGELKKEMEDLASELKISENIRFLGKVDTLIPRLMGSLDILVQPSLTESFGLAPAEALSCGVPVIASRVGGLSEIITEGECGYLVPPEDPIALAARINELLEHNEKRLSFGKAGRKRVKDKFNDMETAGQYLLLYRDLLKLKKGSI